MQLSLKIIDKTSVTPDKPARLIVTTYTLFPIKSGLNVPINELRKRLTRSPAHI